MLAKVSTMSRPNRWDVVRLDDLHNLMLLVLLFSATLVAV